MTTSEVIENLSKKYSLAKRIINSWCEHTPECKAERKLFIIDKNCDCGLTELFQEMEKMTNTNESKWRRCTTTFAKRDNPFESEIVEVVETGALDELRTQLAAAKDEIESYRLSAIYSDLTVDIQAQEIVKLTEENARLKSEIQLIEGAQKSAVRFNEENKQLIEKLRVAKKTLEHYATSYQQVILTGESLAKEAIAKLEDGNE